MKRFPWSPRPPICLLLILALARLYRGSGKLGLLVARIHPRATAVRPPTGLARAAMLLFGYRVWPGCSWAKATSVFWYEQP